jgi:hypothetical protein
VKKTIRLKVGSNKIYSKALLSRIHSFSKTISSISVLSKSIQTLPSDRFKNGMKHSSSIMAAPPKHADFSTICSFQLYIANLDLSLSSGTSVSLFIARFQVSSAKRGCYFHCGSLGLGDVTFRAIHRPILPPPDSMFKSTKSQ